VNLNIYLCLAPKLRISGAILLLPYIPSWREEEQLTFSIEKNVNLSVTYIKSHDMKEYGGNGGIAPLIFKLGASDQRNAQAALPSRKELPVQLNRRQVGRQYK
jgi:hypothetical protein